MKKKRIQAVGAILMASILAMTGCGKSVKTGSEDSSVGSVEGAYQQAVQKGFTGTAEEWLASLAAENVEGELSAYEVAVKNGYKGTETEWLDSLIGPPGKSAYELAVDEGYQGTEREWLASLAAENGAGAEGGKSAYETAVENGYKGTEVQWLRSILGNNANITAGVKGDTGAQGEKGDKGDTGAAGTQGEKGDKGDTGAQGEKGETGIAGKSAYELAVDNGYQGTLAEWLESLATGKGDKGDTGAQGEKGDKGDTGAQGEKGDKGDAGADGKDGVDGTDGKSAYELAVDNGYSGTLTEWLASLVGAQGEKGDKGDTGAQGEKGDKGDTGAQGEKGDKGDTGAQGEKGDKGDTGAQGEKGDKGDAGEAGKSAYELAKEKGYTGTQQEWLASLVGAQGEKGDKGDTGAQGEKGDKGDTGAQGEKGDKGDTGAQGEKGDKGDTGAQGEKGDTGAAGKSAYELAKEKGYTGTEEEWLASLVGAQGEKGDKGDTGTQGEKGDKGDTGAQGEKGDKGDTGAQGEKGDKGDTGAQGEKGDKGDAGADGKTAYELAKEQDPNVGTLAEWLDSLAGKNGIDGTNGKDGENGKSAYELAKESGFEGTLGEWLVSLCGADGADGKSAYELAKEQGYSGTVQEWLASLVGPKGADGKSAFELAQAAGYTGTEKEWLASLKGEKGDKGDKGDTGAQGEKGDTGAAGVGIAGASINEEHHLILTLTDGSSIDAGYVGGEATKNSFVVTFVDYDHSILKTEIVPAGGSATPPETPTREGYVFQKWSGSYENVSANTVVTAVYVPKSAEETMYTVTFKDYDGRTISSERVKKGESATPPADPSRAGYIFKGWSGTYTNVTADTVVTAVYEEDSSPMIIVNSTSAKVGDETVTVDISLKNNPGISGLKLFVEYSDILTLENVTFNSAYGANVTATQPFGSPQSISFISPMDDVRVDGTFATLTFSIKGNVTDAVTAYVNVSFSQEDTMNKDLDDVAFKTVNGTVSITK